MNHEDKNISIDLYGDGIGRVQLVQSMGSDATIVRAARVSFGKDESGDLLSDKDKKLIRYLIKHRHTSTLEHCNVTFKCVVPLFIRSQHHRHRTWSYNEISRRYTAESLEFYEPKTFRTQHSNNRQASNNDEQIDPILWEPIGATASEAIRGHHEDSVELYNKLMEKGVCREQARGVLPQNLYTEYYASANLNNILKFIDLRSHDGAQWEIQKYSQIVDAAKEKIENFDEFMNTERDNILNLRGEIQQMADEIASNIRFVKPSIRPNAATIAQGAIDNAQATSQGATQQFKPPELDPELFGDEEKDKSTTKNRSESKVFEEANMAVRPALDYSHDPDKAEWMAKYLPMMVRSFKKKYAIELSKKHPTYSDHQIAYTIEDNIDFLFKHEENPISKQTMDAFYNWVKTDLFGQPPESSTLHLKQNDLFSESLDKTYERMLDNLIGLPYIKG